MTNTDVHTHGLSPSHPHEHRHDDGAADLAAPFVEGQQHHGPSYEGTAILDIGGSIGAVMLLVGADLAGVEVDLPGDEPGTPSTHSLVRERVLPKGVTYAAVYPQLPEGRYHLDARGHRPARSVVVRGGEVTKVDWR